ncbi:MAG: GNAT family N-acetyltransferase [Planctomycetes bacterium]|nr:GNAT family N-acetyltransferase [Planctomycetota bacterium]
MSRTAADLRSRALPLMERVLREGGPLAPEYPLCFQDQFPGRVLAIQEQERVVSACAVLVRDFVVGTLNVRVGLIGSVCTDPAQRGRGLASQLLQRAEDELAQDGCMLALLWADDPIFYDERGWQPVGAEIDFAIETWQAGRLAGASGIRAAAPDDRGAIHRLYSLHRERVDRSCEESNALLASPGVETLVLQRSRDVVAYSCMGRGKDFAHTVHEWAGSDADVIALLRAHLQRAEARGENAPLYVITPPTAHGLHARLRGLGLNWTQGVLAQGKLLDPHAAVGLLATLTGPDSHFSVETEVEDGRTQVVVGVQGPRGRTHVGTDELLSLLIPARGKRLRLDELERACGVAWTQLPLPLFAWGLDSI